MQDTKKRGTIVTLISNWTSIDRRWMLEFVKAKEKGSKMRLEVVERERLREINTSGSEISRESSCGIGLALAEP